MLAIEENLVTPKILTELPTQQKDLKLKEEPRLANAMTLTCSPTRMKLLREKLEPKEAYDNSERLPPILVSESLDPVREMLDPKRMKDRTLIAEPRLAKPKTENILPIRAELLREKLLPKCMYCITETADPSRPKLLTESDEPK
jgi:hypothetical protein